MPDVLTDYLQLYNRYPANAHLSKAQRKTRHNELMKWTKQAYQAMPDINEIITFMQANDTLHYEQPFFTKVVIPCVLKDIDNGKITSLRFLFACNGMDSNKGTTTDYINLLCAATNYKYDNTLVLADMVLLHEPENQIVLNYKYMTLLHTLNYFLHEVPWAVLCNKEAVPYRLKELNEFAIVSEKIGKYDGRLIQKWGDIFTAWGQYLSNEESYSSFEDYLIINQIAYG